MKLTREQFESDAKEKFAKGEKKFGKGNFERMSVSEVRKELYEEMLDIYKYAGHPKMEDERYMLMRQDAFEMAIMLKGIDE